MAASKSTTAPASNQDEVDEMFGKDAPAAEGDDFAGMDDLDDLLNQVEEDDSEGWVPSEKGEGIVGKVIKLGETKSDFAGEHEDPMCPTVTLECKDPANPGKTIKWRVIGYGAVLKRELKDQDPQVGDIMAVKYFGEKPIKNGKFQGRPYKHFGVVVKRKSD
jgi:hypothetical protein